MNAIVPMGQGAQSEIWEELSVKNQWFHVMRADVLDNKIAEMGTTAWCVYCIIKAYTNLKSGESWPSQATIAGHMGVSVDTVARATQKLEEMGKIKSERRGRKRQYLMVEQVPLERKSDQVRVGVAHQDYIPMMFEPVMNQIKQYAAEGKLPANATFNLVMNVNYINQGDNSTVNIQNVSLGKLEEITSTDAAYLAAEGIRRPLSARAKRLKSVDIG